MKILPAAGRSQIGFFTIRDGKQALVVPRDAAGAIARHEVDASAFTVDTAGEHALDTPGAGSGSDAGNPLDPPAGTPTFNLTINVIGLDGNPAVGDFSIISRVPNALLTGAGGGFEVNGTKTVKVAAGNYFLYEFSQEPVFIGVPRLDLDRDITLTFDHRQTKPIAIDVPGVDLTFDQFGIAAWDEPTNVQVSASKGGSLRTAQLGPEAPADQFRSWIVASAAPTGAQPIQPGAGDFPGLPDNYAFAHEEHGHVVTGFRASIPATQLATVDLVGAPPAELFRAFLAVGPDDIRPDQLSPEIDGGAFGDYAAGVHHTDHLFGPNMRWQQGLSQIATIHSSDQSFAIAVDSYTAFRTYQPGEHVRETFHRAPFGPAFAQVENLFAHTPAGRDGDVITLAPSMFSDRSSPADTEEASTTAQQLTLSRNGTQIATSDEFSLAATVPADDATYRLDADYERGQVFDLTPFDLSTHVTADWTFHSAHVDSFQSLPLPTLRFAPELGPNNNAGRVLVLPAIVERPPGAATPRITKITVEVSFDDGATWQPVHGAAVGPRFVGVVLDQPATGFASLRGTVEDADGRESHVQIIRAYRLGS